MDPDWHAAAPAIMVGEEDQMVLVRVHATRRGEAQQMAGAAALLQRRDQRRPGSDAWRASRPRWRCRCAAAQARRRGRAPRFMWPTSELPIWPLGRPTNVSEASIEALAGRSRSGDRSWACGHRGWRCRRGSGRWPQPSRMQSRTGRGREHDSHHDALTGPAAGARSTRVELVGAGEVARIGVDDSGPALRWRRTRTRRAARRRS